MGGERAAVVKRDAGPHQKTVSEPIRGYPHRARGKSVEGIRLVGGARHQARKGELHALRAVALEDEDVERIECEKVLIERARRPDMGEYAALRRVRVDIIEMLEPYRIFEIAEGRHAVALGLLRCLHLRCFDTPGERRCEPSCTKEQRFAAR